MITSEYIAMSFDATEEWQCTVDGPKDAGGFQDRTWRFDFATGARAIGLVPRDISLLGEPQEIRIRLRGSSHGHALRLQMLTHFMFFERTLGSVEGDGLREIVIPAPPAEGWRWFSGENDGKVHGPLRITGLFLDGEGKTGTGQLEMIDIRIKARCPAERTSILMARMRSAKPGPQFVATIRSMTPKPFDATVRCIIRDWDGRTIGSHVENVRVSSSQATRVAVAAPIGEHAFLEAEFAAEAPGQVIQATSACYTAATACGGSDRLDPASTFGMGVYLYRYPDPQLMDRAARLARDIGVKWSREEFLWASIERRKGEFDWSFYDRVVATAKSRGISIYGLLDYWSDWTKPYTPEGIEDYCRYAQAVVQRYKNDIHIWEVWNEPNIFFWQGPKDMYVDLLKAAYAAIKEVDPTAAVAGCSTSGIDLDFIRRVMELGGPFDILTVHPYRVELKDREFIQELRNAAKLAGRPVWITEMGWGTHVPHTNVDSPFQPIGPRQQACLLARTYIDALASGVPNTSWYDFRNDGTNALEWEHNLGIITQDFQWKPACQAYAVLTRMLEGRQVQEELDIGEDVLAFRFAKPDGRDPVTVLWSVDTPRDVVLAGTGQVTARNLMGEVRRLPVQAGWVKVDLAPGAPVFVSMQQ